MKPYCSNSIAGRAEEILPKHLPPSLALSDTLLPFQYFSRISTHDEVALFNPCKKVPFVKNLLLTFFTPPLCTDPTTFPDAVSMSNK